MIRQQEAHAKARSGGGEWSPLLRPRSPGSAVYIESLYWNADGAVAPSDSGRHNRYLDVPGFAPVLVTRDPQVIRAISTETGAKPGQFDRDSLPSSGIARALFEQLTDVVIAARREGRGLWKQFRSDAPDDALRSNIRVFLAGALEATTSYAGWAIAHLSRNPEAQEKTYREVCSIDEYTPL